MERKYDNSNTGALFFRENEEGSKRPSITGKITFGKNVVSQLVDALAAGEECSIEVAGWEKQSKAGKPFISVTIKGPADAAAYKNNSSKGSFKKAPVTEEIEF